MRFNNRLTRLRRCALLPVIAALLALGGCGGGGGSSSSSAIDVPASTADNTVTITVEPGPANNVNLPFVSVTICTPGNSSECQTIDHILVDTGSWGLRIIASQLASNLSLTQQTDGTAAIVECTQFADGYSWGPVKLADITIGGETASAVPIQVIGDSAFPTAPSACISSGNGVAEDSVLSFGANGVLGVGVFEQDCGAYCAANPANGFYYTCSGSTCSPSTVALSKQVVNPVARFSADNNGVIITLPAVGSAGAATVSGTLTFGIGTQSNNSMASSAAVYDVDPNAGTFTTDYGSGVYPNSFLDSGSNALFFADASITACDNSSNVAGFYCPASTLNLYGVIYGYSNGNNTTVYFNVANAQTLVNNNPTYAAFSNLASPHALTGGFDWGLPFYYGRTVYTAIENKSVTGSSGTYYGPFVAF